MLHLKSVIFLVLGTMVLSSALAQECEPSANKKALKLYEKGTDKKNKKAERIGYLKQCLQLDEEYAAANWALASIMTKDARYKGKSYNSAKKYLLKAIESCPNVHSSPYFYLGKIAMEKGEFEEAQNYFQQFYKFESDDSKKFERRYDEFIVEAKEEYKWAKFYAEQFNNPVAFKPQMVANISTQKDEYLPLVSPDNSKMFFTRRFKNTNAQKGSYIKSDQVDFIEIFSEADYANYSFNGGKALPSPFNEIPNANYGGASISIDNKELFITICKPEAGIVNCDIYTSKYVYGFNNGFEEWHGTKLQNMGPNVNTDDGWEAQPSLSKDGKLLLFASAREGSKGIDIYQTKRNSNGDWGAAERVPFPISTDKNDKTPFFHSDSKTLYYASQGHLNHGGYDVFYVRMNDDGSWTTPVNLGYPINTEKDELGFVVSTDGRKVFYTSKSDNPKNGLDIYSFELYEEARPEKVLVIKGDVKNSKGKVPKNTTVQVKNPNTEKIETFEVDSVSGSYTAIVTVDKIDDEEPEALIVKLQSDEEDLAFESFAVSTDTTKGIINQANLEAKTISSESDYTINSIQYATSSAELTDVSKLVLTEFAQWLIQHPSLKVDINGHTDNVGDDKVNLALSTDRAYSVKDYLESEGVAGNRLTFKGYGETKPVASNATEEGRKKNRRTTFKIISQ